MPSEEPSIQHVSDTAIWVAHYRARESERPDALFQDALAKVLVGARGREIAESMKRSGPYTRWSVVIRTRVIDTMIQERVASGVDTVLNLGAGLDTRPYRLALPPSLRWIEVDYPSVVEHKERLLASEKPGVRLQRIALDLADRDGRRRLFSTLGGESRNTLVLTEGVIPYLSEDEVGALAEDLHAVESFRAWIAEYYAPEIYRYFKTKERERQMRNAPVRFLPSDWLGVFRSHGWAPGEVRYLPEESLKLNRQMPVPWWARILLLFMSKDARKKHLHLMAYVAFEKA